MANFNRGNKSGSNRGFGKPRFNNDRPEMYKATCANCGKICEVPFRPTGSKPVFCKDCFQNNQSSDLRRTENRSFSRPRSDDRLMYDAVCAVCGNNCQVPFRPTQGRDILCSNCFEKNESSESRRPERRTYDKPSFNRSTTNDIPNYKTDFEDLNAKMDKILSLLTPIEIVPFKSEIDKNGIEEIVEEVPAEKSEAVTKKSKKAKVARSKPKTKTNKTSSSKRLKKA